MEEVAMTANARAQRDPAKWTLADLSILVLGSALAFSLPWLHDPSAQITLVSGPAERRFMWAETAVEVLQKTALALVPLALWRRARRGGVLSASEFLLVVCVAPLLASQVEQWEWVRKSYYLQVRRLPDGSHYESVTPGAPFWYVHAAAGALYAASVLLLLFQRKRMADWVCSSLLIVAYVAAIPWVFDALGEHLERLLDRIPGEGTFVEYALAVALELPLGLAPAVIGAAALRDFARRRPAALLEWLGLGIALSTLVLRLAAVAYLNLRNRTPPVDMTGIALEIGLLVTIAALAPLVVWRLGPAWSRWLSGKSRREPGRVARGAALP